MNEHLGLYNPLRVKILDIYKIESISRQQFKCDSNDGISLVISIFSFSHSVFYSMKERNHHSKLVCRLQMLSIWLRPKFLSFGKNLKLKNLW